MSMNVLDGTRRAVGYEHIDDTSSAVGVTTTGLNARVAIVQAITAAVNWRDDGTDPTAGDDGGMQLAAGESFLYVGTLQTLKFINTSAGSGALVNLSYYA